MDDHLAKPVTRSELKSTIAKWLRLESTAPLAPAPPPPKGMTLDIPMLERLESDLGDDGKEVLGGLVEAFFADFQAAMDRLDALAEAQDWAKLSFEAHRLRSSTSNLAAADLAVLCRNLEECGQRPDPDLAAELMLRVREEYGRVREALTAHVGRVVPASGERSRDMSDIKPTRETTSVPR
jgi:HPt (histidine-containing phosphotransfer) domain-containing protein